jgi:hypothetical protein
MIGKLQCVVLDCPDGPGLARFYQALLGGEVNRADPRWAVDDDFSTLQPGSGLVFAFQREAGAWQRKPGTLWCAQISWCCVLGGLFRLLIRRGVWPAWRPGTAAAD